MSPRLQLGVALYLLAHTYSEVTNFFDTDDMMNLYGAWHRFSDQVRPVGAVFYRVIYELAGFQPLPFRLAALALILVNLALMARLLLRLSGHPVTVAAGLFFACFQGHMWMIYASTGMIYDVLCATFLYAALLLALERPTWWFAIGLLHLGALGSKELGVALPALLLLLTPKNRKVIVLTSAMSAVFLGQRFLLKGPLTGHPAYTPEFTLSRLLENITVYTNILTSHALGLTPLTALLLWAAVFFLARNNKQILIGLLCFWIAFSPMLTGTPRHAGYVFYVPFFGLALAAGAAFRSLYEQTNHRRLAAALFIALTLSLHLYQKRVTMRRGELPAGHDAIRQLSQIRLPLQPGHRVLLINSPGVISPWLSTFTLTLTHKVRDLTIDDTPDPAAKYDIVHRLLPPGDR